MGTQGEEPPEDNAGHECTNVHVEPSGDTVMVLGCHSSQQKIL